MGSYLGILGVFGGNMEVNDTNSIEIKKTAIAAKAAELEDLMKQIIPPGRKLSLAVTNLEQSILWARSAIEDEELVAGQIHKKGE